MRQPPIPTRLFGHPVVAMPLTLGGCGFLYGCWQAGNDGALPGILTLATLALVGKASERMSAYRAWKRAWDGMDDRPKARLRWRVWGASAFLATLVLYLISTSGETATQAYVGMIAIVLGLAAVVAALHALWRRVAPKRRTATSGAVTISAKAGPVPTLGDAYAALPEHCRQVMGGRP